jgi:hypothetical protein
MEISSSEIELVAHTTETSLEMEFGVSGIVWVTAVYSNPERESEPSNIQINENLPISLQEVKNSKISLSYNR